MNLLNFGFFVAGFAVCCSWFGWLTRKRPGE